VSFCGMADLRYFDVSLTLGTAVMLSRGAT
jgi:hypothetical protein